MPRRPARARRFLDTRHAFGGARRDARGIPINGSTQADEVGEWRAVVEYAHGRAYLAEAYCGWSTPA
jgi:hypothetical protein